MSALAVQLKVTLRDIAPPIWRRLLVPGSMTLAELHDVIQTAMGWMGYHVHLFEAGGVVYRTAAADSQVLAVLADPNHPDHGSSVDRYGTDLDSEHFDLDAVNEMLAL